ncbi:protein-disulfide reductase DsbD family protein [Alienimonas chondri]|uniref:Thiol:disulfide interchange protein DsbD n=1 Tax=Alienimonas chondri TaxID=2681879 RepID=A0ABX1VNC0_9PLAN|nr:cytochrome c biogenesis protein CcdA [Alienimonas chondri]NNJ27901.1 Thiol:disulfide interchange protein DsbD [Alienimonas chondri]
MPARPFAAVARRLLLAAVPALAGLLLCPPPTASGQGIKDVFDLPTAQVERLGMSARFLDGGGDPLDAPPPVGETLTLAITAEIPDGFYLVSQTSLAGQPAKLKLAMIQGLEAIGDVYAPDHAPKEDVDPLSGEAMEKFTDEVTWTRSFKVVGEGPLKIEGELRGSYCKQGEGGVCVPLFAGDAPFSATLAAAAMTPAADADSLAADDAGGDSPVFTFADTPGRGDDAGPVAVEVALPADAAVGDQIDLTVTLRIGDGYHIYAMQDPGPAATPTTLSAEVEGLTARGEFVASKAAEAVEHGPDVVLREHHGTVAFTRSYEVTDETYGLNGSVRYQVCTDTACQLPKTVRFTLDEASRANAPAVASAPASAPPTAAPGESSPPQITLTDTFELDDAGLKESGLWAALPLAFLGGLILNVMPCVLPVIALKAMSFAKQAGESRATVLKLNLWYSAGVLTVFLVFAGLTFGLGAFLSVNEFGWGDQVNSNRGKVVFTVLVFVLGLSMLGLFEIPVPGFVGSAAGKTGHKGGGLGAYLGGIFTTLLATPCTGPFIGAAAGFAVGLAETNPVGSVAMWLAMGVGFASPYLLLAVLPGATRFLPKPGDWMVWFKEFGGLLLLGTALWLMQGVRPYELWLPILVGLLGLAIGLWIVGRVIRHNDSFNRKYGLRALAVGVTGAMLAFAVWLAPEGGLEARPVAAAVAEEGWEPFDAQRLNELRAEGKTVLVDFRSAVCVNCDLNEKFAIDTATAHEAYDQLDIVTMKGWIDRSDETYEWLKKLGGAGVPHLAVFPGDRPNDPATHNGTISQAAFLTMLEEAAGKKYVPSGAETTSEPVRTAER